MVRCVDIDRIKASIRSGTISLPRGLSHEERKAYIKAKLDEKVVAACVLSCGNASVYAYVTRQESIVKQTDWPEKHKIQAWFVDKDWTERSPTMTDAQHDWWKDYFINYTGKKESGSN